MANHSTTLKIKKSSALTGIFFKWKRFIYKSKKKELYHRRQFITVVSSSIRPIASDFELLPNPIRPTKSQLVMAEDNFEESWSMLLEGGRSGSLLTSRVGLPLRIRSASLSSLTELCIFCFDEHGTVRATTSFPYVFFLTHIWFTSSEELAFHLRKLFELGRPSYDKDDYLALLSNFQQLDSGDATSSQEDIQIPSVSTSVILNGKQDDCNGNVGQRSLAPIGLPNGRSNSVLIPRPACIGVEDDNYLNYYYIKLNSLVDKTEDLILKSGNQSTEIDKGQTESTKSSESSCPSSSCKHDQTVMCPVYKFRRSVCYAVHFWINQFPVHFDLDVKLSASMKEWQRCLATEDQGVNYSELAPLVDLSCLPSYDWIRNISVRDPNIKHCRKVSLVFNHLEPMDLATHLTYLEHRIMRRISDFKHYAITQSLRDIPRLERSINFFNGLTHWVQCIVLSRSTPEQRAEVFVKLIEVTKKLKELRNFNSLFAIVGGLNHSSLARLTRTTSRIPSDSQRSLAELSDFLSSSSNFSNYRKTLQSCKGFKIPILGVHMKDLISLHVALPDGHGGLINFRKIIQLSVIFKELQELQNHPLLPGANLLLVNTLRLSLELASTEDEIYELSLAREPKDGKETSSISPPHSPSRSFGELPSIGLGIQIPNSSSCNKAQCVNDKVTGSYPQTSPLLQQKSPIHADASFLKSQKEDTKEGAPEDELSVDQTGDLATRQKREENGKTIPQSSCTLKTTSSVFMQYGSNNVHKRDFNFPGHHFQETTSFFLPCTCNHCNGLLWGPFLRQGTFHKCRVCDYKICSSCFMKYSANSMCKDVNISCRPKTIASSCSISDALDISTNRTRFRYRKKLNSQSDVDRLETKIVGGILPFLASSCEKAANTGVSATSSSPIPIFQRKTSFLFSTASHSYSGSETHVEDHVWSPRSLFSTSPKRRIQ